MNITASHCERSAAIQFRGIVAVCLLLTIVSTATAKYSGGTGEPGDPYQIATAADLMLLGETPDDYDKHFVLVDDIDLDPKLPGRKVFDRAVIAPDVDDAESGPQGSPFTGVFDGNGHKISHPTIVGRFYLGLFGKLDSGGHVKNLGVVDVNIVGLSGVGALVGINVGCVQQCYSTGAVRSDWTVGGLVGLNPGGIIHCYSTSAVSGENDVGGLVGGINGGRVTHCYSTGVVRSTGKTVGGLVGGGEDNHSVTACFWDTQTSGQTTSAAGTGKTTAEMQDVQTYLRAWWDFVGESTNGIQEVWQIPDGGGYPILAIFSGYVPPQLQGSGTPEDPYLISNVREMGAVTHYSPSAHYRLTASIDLSGIHWHAPVILQFAGTFDGNGHTISHLTITGAGHLGLFGELASPGEVKNLAAVDVRITGSSGYVGGLVGRSSGSVTTSSCTGTVSGTGDYVGGLVGYSYWPGTLMRCYSAGTVNGTDDYVGGLVGGIDGWGWGLSPIADCWSSSAVSGEHTVGGLVGINWGVPLTHCYSTGAVSGDSAVGGLVGYNRGGAVTHCYSTGAATGHNQVGGLVGINDGGSVVGCYSTGRVSGTEEVGGLVGLNTSGPPGSGGGIVTGSFWDTETSGRTTSAGGAGKTTAEMQMTSAFLEAGWDFVGETGNGTEDIWWILEGKDYPRLWWECGQAFSPDPVQGAADVSRLVILRWISGGPQLCHEVYFGDDETLVADATSETQGVYHGRQGAEMTTYDPGILEWGKTYYWRIDEADPNSVWKGNVWSFTTADFNVVTVIDDFESYTDDMKTSQAIFQIWLDGFGYPSDPNEPNDPPAYAGNDTGSYVGNWETPYAEQTIIHGGRQSMPMYYFNNAGGWYSKTDGVWYDPNGTGEPWYSETERNWETSQDWTIEGADMLTLYFRGGPDNGLDPLYMGIADSAGRMAVVVHPDAEAVQASEWQKWHIGLAEVWAAGVDVGAVKKMVIGVGDRKNPKPGGTGRIYIDDIRLTKRMP